MGAGSVDDAEERPRSDGRYVATVADRASLVATPAARKLPTPWSAVSRSRVPVRRADSARRLERAEGIRRRSEEGGPSAPEPTRHATHVREPALTERRVAGLGLEASRPSIDGHHD